MGVKDIVRAMTLVCDAKWTACFYPQVGHSGCV